MALAIGLLVVPFGSAQIQAQIVYAGGLGFSAHGKHSHLYGFAGGFYSLPRYYSYGYGYGPGWGVGYWNNYFLPPPVYYPPPVVVVVNNNFTGGALPGNPLADATANPPAMAPAVARNLPNVSPPPGQFIMITPKPNAGNAANPMIPNGTTSPMLTQVMPQPPRPLPVFDPFANNNPTNIERPEKDADREYARLIKLAGEAFAGEENGRCVGLLERAMIVKPGESLPQFLKAQCLFAAGQYGEAVDAIRDGMKLAPDWPANTFRPRDYYGAEPQRFGTHLAALRKALAENPGEPLLQFLLGYELWFNQDREEARELFRAAARGAKGNPLIARFLTEAEKK